MGYNKQLGVGTLNKNPNETYALNKQLIVSY